jgi:diguanylate cyclase (GGDEF)-like protein
MAIDIIPKTPRELAGEALKRLESMDFGGLVFPAQLEEQFEEATRKSRSFRMWAEGLVAILALNCCLLLDSLFVRDMQWMSVVRDTMIITPIALAANLLVYRNPRRWLREGSIALAMVAICIANLWAEGTNTVTGVFFGVICVMITALFVGVVMRLRFPYAAVSITAMAGAGFWSLRESRAINASAAVVGASLLLIGLSIILVACHSLERAERCSYLLSLERERQAEELAFSNRALLQLSRQDRLTGLPNRHAFEEHYERMWLQLATAERTLAAILLDVDHFKQVNDRHGHLYGDETLHRIGQLLGQALRSPEDMAARYGGEEFVILLSNADAQTAKNVAERVRQLVEAAGTPVSAKSGLAHWITVSCGVSACVPQSDGRRNDLIAAADEALYKAKREGRNRVIFQEFEPVSKIAAETDIATLA